MSCWNQASRGGLEAPLAARFTGALGTHAPAESFESEACLCPLPLAPAWTQTNEPIKPKLSGAETPSLDLE